ncbi:hypothetical protein PPERSA_12602 [Pseudocohnilembus persalinus]|uniref:Uncharacterized protein n=1 Tax=Pseudocohnilembus persalinus TaxID=266149 RepID=A0A0V0QCF6_PSEPJ|nr:hypothetical protein PPERSA_12602 [Pseudocohnilembus persalinus]|eukprot:KRW99926.1 hypothetical protein PPERSA_12602 [Pseudocohnilembus persalinus]
MQNNENQANNIQNLQQFDIIQQKEQSPTQNNKIQIVTQNKEIFSQKSNLTFNDDIYEEEEGEENIYNEQDKQILKNLVVRKNLDKHFESTQCNMGSPQQKKIKQENQQNQYEQDQKYVYNKLALQNQESQILNEKFLNCQITQSNQYVNLISTFKQFYIMNKYFFYKHVMYQVKSMQYCIKYV